MAVVATVAFPLLEVAHGTLGIPINVWAALVHVSSVVVGAMLAAKILPLFTRNLRGSARPGLLTAVYALLLLLWFFRPYQLEISGTLIAQKLTGEWWLPLAALRVRMDVFSVVDVVAGFFLYLPMGALFAVWPLRLRGRLRGVIPALLFIVVIEMMHTFVAYRWPDSTDVLVQSAGVLVGWLIVRRAGFKPYGELLGGYRHAA